MALDSMERLTQILNGRQHNTPPIIYLYLYSLNSVAQSTLIRFQTKTELFCSGYRYGYRPHYNAENEHRKNALQSGAI